MKVNTMTGVYSRRHVALGELCALLAPDVGEVLWWGVGVLVFVYCWGGGGGVVNSIMNIHGKMT